MHTFCHELALGVCGSIVVYRSYSHTRSKIPKVTLVLYRNCATFSDSVTYKQIIRYNICLIMNTRITYADGSFNPIFAD